MGGLFIWVRASSQVQVQDCRAGDMVLGLHLSLSLSLAFSMCIACGCLPAPSQRAKKEKRERERETGSQAPWGSSCVSAERKGGDSNQDLLTRRAKGAGATL